MSLKRRSIINTQKDSEDLFGSPKRPKKQQRKTQNNDDDVLQNDSLFGTLITKAGYTLKCGDQPNFLKCDQALFQRDLRWSLRSHSLYKMPEIAEKFVQGLEEHFEDPIKLKWALLYTKTLAECETARGSQQDSLVRLCLNIEELQSPLITLLTEKLLEIAHDDEVKESYETSCLILANLKWLDRIVDSKTLTDKLVDLLEGSPIKVQKEVVTFVTDIVDDADHPRIAEVLCDLYTTTRELTPAILDALGNLTLPADKVEEVRHNVLKTLQATRPHQLPVVVKFLLHNTPQSIAYQVVSDMREKINLPGDSPGFSSKSPRKSGVSSSSRISGRCVSSNDDAAYEVLLLANIKMASLIHKFLTNAWLKAVQDVDDVRGVRPLDLIILLVLHDAAPSRRRPIESIIRNKIRTGHFTETWLEKVFAHHETVLKEYFEPLKKITSLLLRSPEPVVSHAGSSLYSLCFGYLGGYQQQEVVLMVLKHLADNSVVRLEALSLLSNLAHKHTATMSKFTIFLKGSLDHVDVLNMIEVKRLLDVVSLLAYSDPSHTALQDELAMLVRKQLSHSEIKYQLMGVLHAVLSVKNMVGLDESTSSLNSSTTRDSASFNSSVKEAENLLRLVLSTTAKSPAASALFMDEMASITLKDGINSKLEDWVCQKMTDDFQETFVLDYAADTQPPEDLLPLEVRWNLEQEPSEDGGGIVLNLAPMVIKAEESRSDLRAKESKLVCLAPQFRLLRMLESRLHNGELYNIDALLGCPVYGPAPSVLSKFDSLSQKEQHAALSCVFYTINWFRELINAFVTQKDKDLKQKVYKRLQEVISLQQWLLQHLIKCPTYTPPLAVFDLGLSATPPLLSFTAKKAKRGRKSTTGKGTKKKVKGKENATEMTQAGTSQLLSQPVSQTAPLTLPQDKDKDPQDSQASVKLDLNSCRPFFRELHLDVFSLLFRKLSLDVDSEANGQLTLAEAEFLLTDLNTKLNHVFEAGTKRVSMLGHSTNKNIGHSHLDLFTPAEVAQRAHSFLKPVCVHLEMISGFFQSLIADNDGVMDAPAMFSERVQPLFRVNTLLFTALNIFLSWPGLQHEENNHILIAVLRTIAKKLEGEVVSGMDQKELIPIVFLYISNFASSVLSLETMVVLVQTLQALTHLPQQHELNEKIVEAVEELLKREWYTTRGERESGAVYNQNVHTLLQIYVKQSKNPLSLVEKTCDTALKEFLDATGRDPHSESYPTCSKGTLMGYYRVMMEYLVIGTKRLITANSSQSSTSEDERLNVWTTSVKVFHMLVMTVKKYDSRSLLGPCLKYSRAFLELFLRIAMPLLDSCLRTHNQEVVTLLKTLQLSTRLLQHVCTHSKVNQDTSLTRFVPPVKRALETLVYRVKAMLAFNKCTSAFWMGNLKNRDLQGEELLSQTARNESEEEEGEDEAEGDNVSDDNQSDVDLDDEGDDDGKKKSNTDVTSESTTDYSVSF